MTLLPAAASIAAVIFDMDGTLVDSESYADRSINALLARLGLPPADPKSLDFHGITWRRATRLLTERYPSLAGQDLAGELQREFHRLFVEEPPAFIPGAEAAMAAACRRFPTAIVTSSNRETVAHLIARMAIGDALTTFVAAEDVSRSKPDPEGYLRAAAELGRDPRNCLVFEDSEAGLAAGRSAGMWTVAITANVGARPADPAHIDVAIRDYTEMPEDFFATL